MTPQRLSIKFFLESNEVDLPAFVPVFHRWIREEATRELLIDVVDYKHVPEGPGIMLVGHETDYAIDLGGGRTGLLVTLKRLRTAHVSDALERLLDKALRAGHLLQGDRSLDPAISFRGDEFEITFLDRLRYPNTEGTRERVQTDLGYLVRQYAGGGVEWSSSRVSHDTRLPLVERVTVPSIDKLPDRTEVLEHV